jgi:hypothetical protein
VPKPPSPRWWSMESAEFEGVNDDWNVIVLEDGRLQTTSVVPWPTMRHAFCCQSVFLVPGPRRATSRFQRALHNGHASSVRLPRGSGDW